MLTKLTLVWTDVSVNSRSSSGSNSSSSGNQHDVALGKSANTAVIKMDTLSTAAAVAEKASEEQTTRAKGCSNSNGGNCFPFPSTLSFCLFLLNTAISCALGVCVCAHN